MTCAQNHADGGIYDYWGVPTVLADVVFEAVHQLVKGNSRHP